MTNTHALTKKIIYFHYARMTILINNSLNKGNDEQID